LFRLPSPQSPPIKGGENKEGVSHQGRETSSLIEGKQDASIENLEDPIEKSIKIEGKKNYQIPCDKKRWWKALPGTQ
jgi:hypothetical protein